MTNKQLKLIYEYMGWEPTITKWIRDTTTEYDNNFDSNSAWECVQEMERKGDLEKFDVYSLNEWMYADNNNSNFWIFNPVNFFDCFSKWLEK